MKQKNDRKVITIKDVAKAAGVSHTTVSFVLNDKKSAKISIKTAERIKQVVDELGYVRQNAGRRLASGSSRTIGLIIGSAQDIVTDTVIPSIMYSLNEVCIQNGYRMLIHQADSAKGEQVYHELARSRDIDGILILNPKRDDKEIISLLDEEFPIVVDGYQDHPNCHAVTGDSKIAAIQAVQYLINLGHTKIAHIPFGPMESISSYRRYLGYTQALGNARLALNDRYIVSGFYTPESGREATKKLLNQAPDISAIFAGNDNIAIGVLCELYSRGIKVPDDIAVMGYDDIPFAKVTAPPLTTIRFPAVEYGKAAGNMLLELISGRSPKERIVHIPTELIIRESC